MKRRTNLTLEPEIYELATRLMAARRFGDFSGFIEQIIREEWERRNGPMQVTEDADITSAAGEILDTHTKSVAKEERRARRPKSG